VRRLVRFSVIHPVNSPSTINALWLALAGSALVQERFESFDRDPRWDGWHNRATAPAALEIEVPSTTAPDTRRFDRFGIVTTWVDGNSQEAYLDDLRYTRARRRR
jgi:hypothetical protein